MKTIFGCSWMFWGWFIIRLLLISNILSWNSLLSSSRSNVIIVKRLFNVFFSVVVGYTSIGLLLQNWCVDRIIYFLDLYVVIIALLMFELIHRWFIKRDWIGWLMKLLNAFLKTLYLQTSVFEWFDCIVNYFNIV